MLSLASFKDAISGKPQLAVTAEEPERRGATPLASLFPDRLPHSAKLKTTSSRKRCFGPTGIRTWPMACWACRGRR
jgi:hypothetical protein